MGAILAGARELRAVAQDPAVGRADIYSLGVVLYELLTGEIPLFGLPMPSARDSRLAVFDQVLGRCLHKNPAQRLQSVGQLKGELERLDLWKFEEKGGQDLEKTSLRFRLLSGFLALLCVVWGILIWLRAEDLLGLLAYVGGGPRFNRIGITIIQGVMLGLAITGQTWARGVFTEYGATVATQWLIYGRLVKPILAWAVFWAAGLWVVSQTLGSTAFDRGLLAVIILTPAFMMGVLWLTVARWAGRWRGLSSLIPLRRAVKKVREVSPWIPATVAGMIFSLGAYFLLYPSVVAALILGVTYGGIAWAYLKLDSEKVFPWDGKIEWSTAVSNAIILSAALVGVMLVVKEPPELRVFLQLQLAGTGFFGQITGWRQGYKSRRPAKSGQR